MMDAESKQKHVHAVFESVAPKYDRMNDLISFRCHKAWRRFTMRKMGVKPGQSSLDLCCGTCDWTIALAEASRTGETVGLDFSRNMLDIGLRKIRSKGLENRIRLVEGNAMELPFPDDAFDFVTIGFGLRNVPDYARVLGEMLRVAKPGGTIVCLEVSRPTWQPFKALYHFYFGHILPLMGKLFAKRYRQYSWLPESLAVFPGRKELAGLFRKVGIRNVADYPLSWGVAALHIGTKENVGE